MANPTQTKCALCGRFGSELVDGLVLCKNHRAKVKSAFASDADMLERSLEVRAKEALSERFDGLLATLDKAMSEAQKTGQAAALTAIGKVTDMLVEYANAAPKPEAHGGKTAQLDAAYELLFELLDTKPADFQRIIGGQRKADGKWGLDAGLPVAALMVLVAKLLETTHAFGYDETKQRLGEMQAAGVWQ